MARNSGKITSRGGTTPPARKSSAGEVDAFLAKVAALAPVGAAGARGKLMFAMDATMSRQPTWDTALGLQAEMFDATAEIGGLDVQLVWFRGFGEFKASGWVSDARALAGEMTGVRCRGGHTQIGRVMAHAVKEAGQGQVNAVVYVGDCMEEDVDALCAQAGELGLRGVPIFLFQEGGDPIAATAFREMARLSGGAYCPFDAGSAQQLRDLLGAVAAYAAGGRKALADYSRRAGGQARLLARRVT